MFRVLTRKRKRRLSSTRTVAVSVGVHLLLLGLVVAHSTAAPTTPVEQLQDEWVIPDPPAPPAPDEPEQPDVPAQPDAPPPPVPGETVELPAPTTVPDGLPDVDPNEKPLTPAEVTGVGRPGDYIGTPPATPTPPNGSVVPPAPLPTFEGYVYETVEEKPLLDNARDVARLLDRNYPEALSEAGIAGQVTLQLIVDENGRVRPGSVRVISASHEEFTAATLRIAERMRFRPARVEGRPVPVMVTLPIDWKTVK
ncbi:MAG TPA: energy transducer TonB [Longimicrobium sp.]|jgi:protein TonB